MSLEFYISYGASPIRLSGTGTYTYSDEKAAREARQKKIWTGISGLMRETARICPENGAKTQDKERNGARRAPEKK